MILNAILTVGWKDDLAHPCSARALHQAATEATEGYEQALVRALAETEQTPVIYGLEQLFRRRTGGFQDLQSLVGGLKDLPGPTGNAAVQCRIDVFAYAFLSGAKNFDFLLPETADRSGPFREVQADWNKTIAALEDFERLGKPLSGDAGVSKQDYLGLRKVIARKSARDERRSLVVLLESGPSTREQITVDLGLNYTLGQRVLGVFTDLGVLERSDGEICAISEHALPLVVFCLRETMGIDLLSRF